MNVESVQGDLTITLSVPVTIQTIDGDYITLEMDGRYFTVSVGETVNIVLQQPLEISL